MPTIPQTDITLFAFFLLGKFPGNYMYVSSYRRTISTTIVINSTNNKFVIYLAQVLVDIKHFDIDKIHI